MNNEITPSLIISNTADDYEKQMSNILQEQKYDFNMSMKEVPVPNKKRYDL